ncbi:MAG: magnesium transporter, partial [Bacilli bacterium]|nr:magnesium transporter [Bacilli bacterium]
MEKENDEIVVAEIGEDDLLDLVRKKDKAGLLDVFEKVPTIDIAEAADGFEPSDLITIFRLVKSEYTADFFDGLSQDTKENLIKAMTDKELVPLINSQAADDIADTVSEMPANLASRVLKAADKEMRKDINALLNYKEGTAGALMTTEALEFLSTATVKDTIESIRQKGKDAETIYTIFVRSKSRKFLGTVDLDDLIFAKDDETLEDIMNQDIVYCQTSTDQEEVAQMFRRYDLNAMAVLNEDQRLVGIITVDDAVDVMTEEAQEDLAIVTHMAPSSKPYMETTAWENAKKSFPWLIALLVLGTFTTMILNRLESQRIFATMGILIAFVPALMDTGGNAGGQTTGLMIRALALDEFGPRELGKVLWKELRAAAIVAAI